jgi:hypothetical protein
MSDWQHIFQSRDGLQPGPDFEERVFSKIRKKKRQRRIGYGVTAMLGILLLFSLLQVFRPDARPTLQSGVKPPVLDKEEIPLREDLFFSTFDSRTRYTLEPVSFQKKKSGDDSAVNQI